MSLDSKLNKEQWEKIVGEALTVGPIMRVLGEPFATRALQDSAKVAFRAWPQPYSFKLAVGYFGVEEARRLYIAWGREEGVPPEDARAQFNKYYPLSLKEKVLGFFR